MIEILAVVLLVVFAVGIGWYTYDLLICLDDWSWNDFDGIGKKVPRWRKNIYKGIGNIAMVAFAVWAMHDFETIIELVMGRL